MNNGNSSIKTKKGSKYDENFKTQVYEELKGTIKIGGLIGIQINDMGRGGGGKLNDIDSDENFGLWGFKNGINIINRRMEGLNRNKQKFIIIKLFFNKLLIY